MQSGCALCVLLALDAFLRAGKPARRPYHKLASNNAPLSTLLCASVLALYNFGDDTAYGARLGQNTSESVCYHA